MVEPSVEAAGIEPAQDSPGYVYVAIRNSDGLVKIGYTADLAARERSLRHVHGDVDVIAVYDGSPADEGRLLQEWAHACADGREWFDSVELVVAAVDGSLL